MKLSERLLLLRKERHLSQEAAAEEIGLAYRSYRRYESGERASLQGPRASEYSPVRQGRFPRASRSCPAGIAAARRHTREPLNKSAAALILESVKKLEELFIAPTARQILHETAQRTGFLIQYLNQESVSDVPRSPEASLRIVPVFQSFLILFYL